jgi:hypothetical protein
MPRGRSGTTDRSGTTGRSGTSRRSSRSRTSRSPRNTTALHRSSQRHNVTLRGIRAHNARDPQGMPTQGNYNPVHRLGSRVRSYSQSMMQRERQNMRRRPHIAALRLAHSRPLNANVPSNMSRFKNPVLAENIALEPMMARTGRFKFNKINTPKT